MNTAEAIRLRDLLNEFTKALDGTDLIVGVDEIDNAVSKAYSLACRAAKLIEERLR